MTKERIEQVLSGELPEETSASDSNGVGVRNVIERLKLFFDDQAQMDIYSEGLNIGDPFDELDSSRCVWHDAPSVADG